MAAAMVAVMVAAITGEEDKAVIIKGDNKIRKGLKPPRFQAFSFRKESLKAE